LFGRCLAPAGAVVNAARTKAVLRLFLVRGLGLRTANILVKHFKEPEQAFDSTRQELEALGVPPDVADDVLSSKSEERAEAEWARAQDLGVTIFDILDSEYPPLLREIYDPPIVLYVRGKKWNVDLPQVAIVGTRRPTGYGLNCAERLAEDLAGARACSDFGPCQRSRRRRASRCVAFWYHVCSFRERIGFCVPERKSQTRRFRGRQRRDYFRVSSRYAAVAAKFPYTQPE
jgi:hypothetical protein